MTLNSSPKAKDKRITLEQFIDASFGDGPRNTRNTEAAAELYSTLFFNEKLIDFSCSFGEVFKLKANLISLTVKEYSETHITDYGYFTDLELSKTFIDANNDSIILVGNNNHKNFEKRKSFFKVKQIFDFEIPMVESFVWYSVNCNQKVIFLYDYDFWRYFQKIT